MENEPDVVTRGERPRRWLRGPKLRQPITSWVALACAASAILIFFGIWWFLTRGEVAEERIVGPTTLPSLGETFSQFGTLWFDRALTRNTIVTLRRVTLGFALACVVGVPLGILAGCFSPARAFLAPAVIWGRYIPLAALIGVTFGFFGIEERQKVMFIFIACFAFVIADVSSAIADISSRYIDTAYTLGATTWQTIVKVLIPSALPAILDSARLLFGLAFGYIMLAEAVRLGEETGGLGNLIIVSQRRGPREHIFLIMLIIPVVAFGIDRILFWMQRSLCPYRFGGNGLLNAAVRQIARGWDDLKCLVWKPRPPFDVLPTSPPDKPEP
ncbi:MAG: ABC transporter permease [Planctomycetes bacterium]|nr:ABC transporter permease [Planctomycetota bacterium]